MKFKNAVKRAYHSTDVYRLERLVAEQTKWQRRETIARNKLAHVREMIRVLADKLAKGVQPTNQERNKP